MHNYQRDGAMRFDANGGGAVNYEPNSFGGPVEDPSVKEPPLPIVTIIARAMTTMARRATCSA